MKEEKTNETELQFAIITAIDGSTFIGQVVEGIPKTIKFPAKLILFPRIPGAPPGALMAIAPVTEKRDFVLPPELIIEFLDIMPKDALDTYKNLLGNKSKIHMPSGTDVINLADVKKTLN